MRHPGDDSFANRRKAANEAKQKLLDKLKPASTADRADPAATQTDKPAPKREKPNAP